MFKRRTTTSADSADNLYELALAFERAKDEAEAACDAMKYAKDQYKKACEEYDAETRATFLLKKDEAVKLSGIAFSKQYEAERRYEKAQGIKRHQPFY